MKKKEKTLLYSVQKVIIQKLVTKIAEKKCNSRINKLNSAKIVTRNHIKTNKTTKLNLLPAESMT